jgi:hypothetical protein
MCVCVFQLTCMYVCFCYGLWKHICIYVYMAICILVKTPCPSSQEPTYVATWIDLHACMYCMYVCMHAYMTICILVKTTFLWHASNAPHMRTWIHSCTQLYMHTYIQTCKCRSHIVCPRPIHLGTHTTTLYMYIFTCIHTHSMHIHTQACICT